MEDPTRGFIEAPYYYYYIDIFNFTKERIVGCRGIDSPKSNNTVSVKQTLWKLEQNYITYKVKTMPHREHTVLPLESSIGKCCIGKQCMLF